jgi:hypothetical protein
MKPDAWRLDGRIRLSAVRIVTVGEICALPGVYLWPSAKTQPVGPRGEAGIDEVSFVASKAGSHARLRWTQAKVKETKYRA